MIKESFNSVDCYSFTLRFLNLFFFFFFFAVFPHFLNFGALSRGQPYSTDADVNHCVFTIYEVGSLRWDECLVGFEPGTF